MTRLALALWLITAPAFARGVVHTTGTFDSGGKPVGVDTFLPIKHGRFPLIVFLHAENGPGNPLYSSYASKLAGKGYAVMVLHYFQSTATPPKPSLEVIKQNFILWMTCIEDSFTYASKQPAVRTDRVGLVGLSLGATLALSVATQDPRVVAVVDFFGLMPDQLAPFMKRMCPTLILHGGADNLVSVDEARKLEHLLSERGVPYKIKIYPKEGHGFTLWHFRDAAKRGIEFLNKNLKVDS